MTAPAPATTRDEMLTTGDVSAITKIPVKTLADWRQRGQGPRSFKLGELVRYLRRDVDEWLAERYAATGSR